MRLVASQRGRALLLTSPILLLLLLLLPLLLCRSLPESRSNLNCIFKTLVLFLLIRLHLISVLCQDRCSFILF